jgi:hypothetical protein
MAITFNKSRRDDIDSHRPTRHEVNMYQRHHPGSSSSSAKQHLNAEYARKTARPGCKEIDHPSASCGQLISPDYGDREWSTPFFSCGAEWWSACLCRQCVVGAIETTLSRLEYVENPYMREEHGLKGSTSPWCHDTCRLVVAGDLCQPLPLCGTHFCGALTYARVRHRYNIQGSNTALCMSFGCCYATYLAHALREMDYHNEYPQRGLCCCAAEAARPTSMPRLWEHLGLEVAGSGKHYRVSSWTPWDDARGLPARLEMSSEEVPAPSVMDEGAADSGVAAGNNEPMS